MLLDHINYAHAGFPADSTERFLYYPTLALYSPIQDSVRTLVGVIFTALSMVTLGLSQPINKIANWTQHSHNILSVPAQIFGNMFAIHSKTLDNLNTRGRNHRNYNLRAEIICSHLFQRPAATKVQTLGKHMIFRASSVMNGLCIVGIKAVIVPIVCLAVTPLALFHCGREEQYNKIALEILQYPQWINQLCFSLRLAVNPLQFMGRDQQLQEFDNKPYRHAWLAPGLMWKDDRMNIDTIIY